LSKKIMWDESQEVKSVPVRDSVLVALCLNLLCGWTIFLCWVWPVVFQDLVVWRCAQHRLYH